MFWGRVAGKVARVPVIVSAVHSTHDAGGHHVISYTNRLLAPITDHFIGVGKTQVQYLAEHEGLPANRTRVIYNGVDHTLFSPDASARAAIRAEIGAGPDAPVLGIVAVLRHEKAHEVLLSATRIVREEFRR